MPDAASVMREAVSCSAATAVATVPMMPPTAPSKPLAIWRRPDLRCASALARARAASSSKARARIRPSLNTWTEAAMAPISSRRSAPGITTVRSCAASRLMAAVMLRIGRAMWRRTSQSVAPVTASPARSRPSVTIQAVR